MAGVGADHSDWTVETFEAWKVDSLKSYLRKRDLKVEGRKAALVARCFAAYEQNVPETITAKQRLNQLSKEYQDLLVDEDGSKLPDPFSALLDKEWIGENEGMKLWPPTMYFDICDWMLKHGCIKSNKSLLSDYKEGKGYSYVASEWLKEVKYHEISKQHPLCYLKADCTPSLGVSDVPQTAWVCIRKNDGTIRAAYRTCYAG